ncbi:MAG TPA: DNA cytosine methyltransferase [Verrucomicrobiae bacterium]|nr:DNA cytosine methyltransferase [Verrucomicrobiae bacterium]
MIDLFAGVGGLSLGAARAGFEIALAVERDKHALTAHKKNFPNIKHSDTDIGELTGEKMLQEAGLQIGELDGLIGGPPCQGFSTMGHRHVTDPRNNLFQKFFSLVAESRPKFFVAENVLGILDSQYDGIRDNAFDLIRDDYTWLEPMQLKASDFGAPTVRERAFFVGWRNDLDLQISEADFNALKVESPTTVKMALHGLPRIRPTWLTEDDGWRWLSKPMPKSEFGERIVNGIPQNIGDAEAIRRYDEEGAVSGCLGTVHSAKVAARYSRLKPGKQDKISKSIRLDANGLCPTLRAGTDATRGSYQAVRPIHPTSPRVITPREAARLQGFPDWFQFAPSKWHSFRQIGNSVSPFVAEAVLKVIYGKISVQMLSKKTIV